MQTEQISISLTPALYNQFTRLKTQGHYPNDQALIQACFEALERGWERRSREVPFDPVFKPYMSHPGLGMDDYDT